MSIGPRLLRSALRAMGMPSTVRLRMAMRVAVIAWFPAQTRVSVPIRVQIGGLGKCRCKSWQRRSSTSGIGEKPPEVARTVAGGPSEASDHRIRIANPSPTPAGVAEQMQGDVNLLRDPCRGRGIVGRD